MPSNGILILDEIQGAQADIMQTNGTIQRAGTLTGIDATQSPDSGVILAVLGHPDLPQLGSLYPGTGYQFVRLIIRGFDTNAVYFVMYYTTFQGIIPSAYIITDHSSMTSRSTNIDPFNKKLLQLSYGGDDASVFTAYEASKNDKTKAYAPVPIGKLKDILAFTDILTPLREISVTRVGPGQPKITARGNFGCVNDSDWPGNPGTASLQGSNGIGFGGQLPTLNGVGQALWTSPAPVGDPLPKGYWLLHQIDTQWSRYQNYFTTTLSALSMVTLPWWQLIVIKDPSTGLYVRPSPVAVQEAIEVNLNDYTPGFQTFTTTVNGKDFDLGFGIFGPYPLANFKDNFGF